MGKAMWFAAGLIIGVAVFPMCSVIVVLITKNIFHSEKEADK